MSHDKACRLSVALLLLTAVFAKAACAQVNYIERNACPGEGCSYGKMTALINVPVYQSDSYAGGIQFFVPAGEEFTVTSINLHHEPVGIAIVTRRMRAPLEDDTVPLLLQPGDTVRILGSQGEGRYSIIARGRLVVAAAFWEDPYEMPLRTNTPAHLVRLPHTHSWYRIRTKAGRVGWFLLESDMAAMH